MQKKEYKVIIVTESGFSIIWVGESKLSEKTMTEALNKYAKLGWEFKFMAIERRRFWLFWNRDAAVITFERSV